jgi:hypothetical protein
MNAAAPKWKHFMRAYGLEDDDKDERDWQADRVRPVSLRVVGNPELMAKILVNAQGK